MLIIKVSRDFSPTPGARKKKDGRFSGEDFLERFLEPTYLKALNDKVELTIDLDGGYGYPTSFLEEAFGGLARKYDAKDILSRIKIISEDEPALIGEIKEYITSAREKK